MDEEENIDPRDAAAAAAEDMEKEEEEGYGRRGEKDPLNAEIPGELKALRACLRCSLVKTMTQFTETGCENCEFLQMEESADRVNECTTNSFVGLISLIGPNVSWVGKWQKIATCKPGMYATEVCADHG